ncbi:MAG: WhiB family transcriptional regulator [Micrococcus sp.]|nr:WhiB family transcriptional regulator [Micrococcus sp.]
MENTQRLQDATPAVESGAASPSRAVPADWFLDPADPSAGRWAEQASLEDQATAFLTAHGLDEDGESTQDTGSGATVTALFPGTLAPTAPAPSTTAPSTQDLWDVLPELTGMGGEVEGELVWQVDALCAQTDPEAFFPEKGGSTRDAKKICSACTVRSECLDYAMANDERFGIWGGLSERERRRLRKMQG